MPAEHAVTSQILVYADSLSWGIVPGTRERQPFQHRWPGALESRLQTRLPGVRILENCLNGRRTAWDDPFKPGRNGREGLAQQIEMQSPLALVILMLGTNDFQSMHPHVAWHAGQGMAALVREIRTAPIEPGMPIPPILIVAPPALTTPTGSIAPKFAGAERKSAGLTEALAAIAKELDCGFFDAGTVVTASAVDGVHLDRDAHLALGAALAAPVGALLALP